ncbi:hypothetical protein L6452_13295 [Arctium lappa]|uniref:Uncharacterized protein n=1 Tax=Arctium lappa TaxID=4217 RepID=A0ACB9CHQ2_ARCLA|nr:hypothetical protein L6452_13295 [Arctium lappa]
MSVDLIALNPKIHKDHIGAECKGHTSSNAEVQCANGDRKAMALTGKLIAHVEMNSGGKVLHDLLRHKPHDIASICPHKVHGCDLVSGQRGAVGSTIMWHYTHDGKQHSTKEIIEEIDEANQKIVFKVIDGELVEEIYKAFRLTFQVEPKQDGKQLGTWTFEFEKPNVSVPYPTSLMDYLCGIIKDMDDHATTK